MRQEATLKQAVTALHAGQAVEIEAATQAEAKNLHAEIVNRLYQISHLWTSPKTEGGAYVASTSTGGELTITVKPLKPRVRKSRAAQ